MGCSEVGFTLGVMLVGGLAYWWVKKSAKTAGPSLPEDDAEPGPRSSPPPAARLQKKNGEGWAEVEVPLAPAMPNGLVLYARADSTRKLDPSRPADGFAAVFTAQGKRPDSVNAWATPWVRRTLMEAWLASPMQLWLRGTRIRARFEVSGQNDPKIGRVTAILGQLAHLLARPVAQGEVEPGPASARPGPEAVLLRQVVPIAVVPDAPPAWQVPAGFDGRRPPARPDDQPAATVADFAASAATAGDRTEREILEAWSGRVLSGAGTVFLSSRVLGRDLKFNVQGGVKVTVEPPRDGPSSPPLPTVVLHVPQEPPGGPPEMGATIAYLGRVRGYNAILHMLYLEQGLTEVR